jgi:GTP-binding protein
MTANYVSKIFRGEAVFIAGAAKEAQFPKLHLPEIAFIGKSNVGKSSLINSICNRKALAKTSHSPGRTQQINFFSLADKLILVDLPGYGFAKVPIQVKVQWEKLIVNYLQIRSNLSLVNLLIDSRHGLKENDLMVLKMLKDFDRNFQIVFTKTDKTTSLSKIEEESKNLLESLGYSCNLIYTSVRSKQGVKELQYSMAECLR